MEPYAGRGTCSTMLLKTGLTPRTAICGKPMPRMPSNLAATNEIPGSWVACTWMFSSVPFRKLIHIATHLSKGLVNHTDPSNTAGVGRKEPRHTGERLPTELSTNSPARTVVNLKVGAVGFVGAGIGAVIAVVRACKRVWSSKKVQLTAGQLPNGAGLRGHPQVAGSCVKNDIEGLSWCAKLNGPIILGLGESWWQ